MEEKIRELLSTIVHPETGKNLVESGFIEHTAAAGGIAAAVVAGVVMAAIFRPGDKR